MLTKKFVFYNNLFGWLVNSLICMPVFNLYVHNSGKCKSLNINLDYLVCKRTVKH